MITISSLEKNPDLPFYLGKADEPTQLLADFLKDAEKIGHLACGQSELRTFLDITKFRLPPDTRLYALGAYNSFGTNGKVFWSVAWNAAGVPKFGWRDGYIEDSFVLFVERALPEGLAHRM